MKTNKCIRLAGYFSIITSVLFIFGCIASSYQTAETLEPSQLGIGTGVLRAENMDNSEADPIDLLDLGFRVGIARGFDAGLAYSFDISSNGGGGMSTLWGDLKFQLSNTENLPEKLTFGTGIIKGYTADYESHLTSLPLRFSVPIDDHFTPTLLYRLTIISMEFFPDNFENIRHEFAIGVEYSFNNHSEKWNPKIGIAIGTFNSLDGSENGDRGLTLNLGFTLESPVSF